MVQIKVATAAEYLKKIPAASKPAISAVRKVILKSLPKGFVEGVNYGMLTYHIPLARYPDTYNKQPLMYAALAAQKNYNALYLTGAYTGKQRKELDAGFKKIGKKPDMGKSCIRFQTPDDLPLETIAKLIAEMSPEEFIAMYEESRTKQGEC